MRLAGPLWCLALATGAAAVEPTTETLQSMQLGAAANPGGLRLLWSGSLRRTFAWRTAGEPWSCLEGGATAWLTPAYGLAGLFAEWQPVPVLVLRAEGQQIRFTGRYGGVLSFQHAHDPFGQPVLVQRRGEEEKESARRLLVQATLQYQTGSFFFRAPFAAVWTRNAGQGPWYYDPYADTLLADGDRLVDAHVQAGWTGSTEVGDLAIGPGYQLTRTREAQLERRRAGLFVFLTRPRPLGGFQRPYLAFNAGRVLQDPNRTRQIFIEASIGGRLGK